MALLGRRPNIDPELNEADLRRLREMLRFGPRPPLRQMATDFGFEAHASLYNAANRYEASKGLKPDEREKEGAGVQAEGLTKAQTTQANP